MCQQTCFFFNFTGLHHLILQNKAFLIIVFNDVSLVALLGPNKFVMQLVVMEMLK